MLKRFVKDTSSTVTALAERRDDLAELVTNTNTTFGAIADENASLDRALDAAAGHAPQGEHHLREPALDPRRPGQARGRVEAGHEAAGARSSRELRPLVHDARPTIQDLNTIVRAPGPNNDLIDLTAKQPQLADLTGSVFPRAIKTLNRAQPVFEYARGYTPDLAAWLVELRPARGELRRQRPLRPRPADVPPDHVLAAARSPRTSRPRSSRTSIDRAHHPLPGRRSSSRPPTARARRRPATPVTRPRPRPAREAARSG